jgi:polysaccharide export outer membrane protein
MLAMAGGLKGSTNETAGTLLFLIRPGEGEEGTQGDRSSREKLVRTIVIDLEDLLGKGDMSLNFPLSHGDVINVPAAGKVFVGGEVKRPGGFPMGKKMTVSQAVALAEGLKSEAKGAETKIFRYSGISGKEILTVNVNEIHKGKAEDIYLKENDIVMVPKDGVKSFFIEFRDTLKGFLSTGFSLGTI